MVTMVILRYLMTYKEQNWSFKVNWIPQDDAYLKNTQESKEPLMGINVNVIQSI